MGTRQEDRSPSTAPARPAGRRSPAGRRPSGAPRALLALLARLALVAVVSLLAPVVAAGSVGAATSAQGSEATTATDPLLRQVGGALTTQGWYTEPGAGIPSTTIEKVARRLRAAGAPWGLVALARPPDGGTRFFAADLLDDVRGSGDDVGGGATANGIATVVVLTPGDVAAESRTYPGDRLDAALAAAIPTFDRDLVGGYEQLFQALSGAPLTTRMARPVRSGGDGKLPMVVAGAALVAAVAAMVVVRGAARRA